MWFDYRFSLLLALGIVTRTEIFTYRLVTAIVARAIIVALAVVSGQPMDQDRIIQNHPRLSRRISLLIPPRPLPLHPPPHQLTPPTQLMRATGCLVLEAKLRWFHLPIPNLPWSWAMHKWRRRKIQSRSLLTQLRVELRPRLLPPPHRQPLLHPLPLPLNLTQQSNQLAVALVH